MIQRIFFAFLLGMFLIACASMPDDGTESEKDKPDAKYCSTDAGDPNGTEVCRQY